MLRYELAVPSSVPTNINLTKFDNPKTLNFLVFNIQGVVRMRTDKGIAADDWACIRATPEMTRTIRHGSHRYIGHPGRSLDDSGKKVRYFPGRNVPTMMVVDGEIVLELYLLEQMAVPLNHDNAKPCEFGPPILKLPRNEPLVHLVSP